MTVLGQIDPVSGMLRDGTGRDGSGMLHDGYNGDGSDKQRTCQSTLMGMFETLTGHVSKLADKVENQQAQVHF